MTLHTYNDKRNFARTPEPRGKIRKTTPHREFCIQKHRARQMHFDLRLEHEGVLKSWAVPKGPSTVPGVRRLAIEVEDHPIDYGHFEGVIPKGEYGGGTVMLWDRGTWEPLGGPLGEPPGEAPGRGLQKGHLSFRLHGSRLHGDWALIRPSVSVAGKNSWFLIKKKDGYRHAKNPAGRFKTSVASGRTMNEIADPNIKLPPKFSPELATLVEMPPRGEGWFHEIKFDGYRIITVVKDKEVKCFTRNKLDWTARMPSIVKAIKKLKLKNAILDGELVAVGPEGKSDFQNLLSGSRDRPRDKIIYWVFDLISKNGKDLRARPLFERKRELEKIFASTHKIASIKLSQHGSGDGRELWRKACRMGFEGIISKKRTSRYVSARTSDWLKTKCRLRQEFVVVGYTQPNGTRGHLGALLLAVHDDHGRLRYVGRVGTGFSQKNLMSVKKRLDHLRLNGPQKNLFNPAKALRPKQGSARDIIWVKPEIVAEVKFASWTHDRILRQAVFQGIREDKKAADVVIETRSSRGKRALVTNPSKILFSPDITKGELASYYAEIWKWIQPYIMNRALAVMRCPDGHEKTCFFQKHKASAAASLKEGEDFLYVDSLQGLMTLAQMAVLEIHGRGAKVDEINKPDWLVFDLDPDPGVKWPAIAGAAITVRERLEKLRLKSFVKTTGGKGLHIVVPIKPEHEWNEVKAFCKAFAAALAAEFPTRFTSKISKKRRGGKIFVDYLRNGRSSTAILPYSTRARANAPVSVPLHWNEIFDVRGDSFTLRDLLSRLQKKKGDPWANFFKIKQRLRIPRS